jgi:hypothetical protein
LAEASIFLSFFQSKKKEKLKLQPKQKGWDNSKQPFIPLWRCQFE